MTADMQVTGGYTNLAYNGRKAPWHETGTAFREDAKITVMEALKIADLDYTIHVRPLTTTIEEQVLDPDGNVEDIRFVSVDVPERVALVRESIKRDPSPRIVSVVSKRFVPLQNRDICAMLDAKGPNGEPPLSTLWPVETVGGLGKYGDRFFVTMHAGRWSIFGDEMEHFVSILDDRRGTSALKVTDTEFRVECANTFGAAFETATLAATMQHNRSLAADLTLRLNLVRMIQETQGSVKEACERLAMRKISQDEFMQVATATYPDPKKPVRLQAAKDIRPDDVGMSVWKQLMDNSETAKRSYESMMVAAGKHRAAVLANYGAVNDKHPAFAGTAWMGFNAITEYEDHLYRHGGNGTGQAESVIAGAGAERKTTAFKAFLSLN